MMKYFINFRRDLWKEFTKIFKKLLENFRKNPEAILGEILGND